MHLQINQTSQFTKKFLFSRLFRPKCLIHSPTNAASLFTGTVTTMTTVHGRRVCFTTSVAVVSRRIGPKPFGCFVCGVAVEYKHSRFILLLCLYVSRFQENHRARRTQIQENHRSRRTQIQDTRCVGRETDTMSPPRLTGALRSFSSVSKKEDFSEQLYDLKVRLNRL